MGLKNPSHSEKSMLNLKISLAVIVFLGLLAGCDPPHGATSTPPLSEGTVANVKILGHHYRGEVTSVHEGYVVWSYTWKKTPVFKFKSYRGLMTIYSEEEGYKYYTKFDPAVLDEFLPIKVGEETSLKGKQISEKKGIEFPFQVTISVRQQTTLKIKEVEFPVYVIDFSFVEEHPEGTKNYLKTIWYSAEMETALRTDYLMDGEIFSIEVISLNGPDEMEEMEESEPEGLGTVRL